MSLKATYVITSGETRRERNKPKPSLKATNKTNQMAQTHVSLFLHVVFSTKHRLNMIASETEGELYAYIGGIIGNHKSKLLIAGGTSNHVHLLISVDKSILISDLIGKIKRDSSKWIKTKDTKYSAFGWQDGYAAFSVGHTQIETVKQYIANQKAHHAQKVFEDELRTFFRKYELNMMKNISGTSVRLIRPFQGRRCFSSIIVGILPTLLHQSPTATTKTLYQSLKAINSIASGRAQRHPT